MGRWNRISGAGCAATWLLLGAAGCGGDGPGGGDGDGVRVPARSGPLPEEIVGTYVVRGRPADGFDTPGRWTLVLSRNRYEIVSPEGEREGGSAAARAGRLVLRDAGACGAGPAEYAYRRAGSELRLTLHGTDDCGGRQVALTFAAEPWRVRPARETPRPFPDAFEARLSTGTRYAAPDDFRPRFTVRVPPPARDGDAFFGGALEPGMVALREARTADQERRTLGVGFGFDAGRIEDLADLVRATRGVRWSRPRELRVDGRRALVFHGRTRRDDVVLEEPFSLAGANPQSGERDTIYFIQAAADAVVSIRSFAAHGDADAFDRTVRRMVRSMRFP